MAIIKKDQKMFSLLKMIVEFTPTQKDDEFLAMAEAFLEEHPELAAEIISLVLKIIKNR